MKLSVSRVWIVWTVLGLALSGCTTKVIKPYPVTKEIAQAAQEIKGHWEGKIEVMKITLAMAMDFIGTNRGLNATMNISAQNTGDIPVQIRALKSSNIVFVLSPRVNSKAVFDGRFSGNSMEGTFNQAGIKGKFSLIKTPKKIKVEIKDPDESGLTVKTPTGMLYGTLKVPPGPGKKTLFIIIAGSGPTDRNGNSFLLPGRNDAFRMIARELAKHGIATFRYDKRGVGESRVALKSENGLTFEDNVKDLTAWTELLRKDGRFDKIGIIGHSEGSLVGMIAASRGGFDYMVSIAGTGRPIDVILKEQLATQPEKYRKKVDLFIGELKKGHRILFVPRDMMSLFRPSIQPYMISWLKIDPAQVASQIKCPFLILQGTTDIQIKTVDAQLLAAANPKSKLVLIEGMNHVMKMAPADRRLNLEAYSNPDLPLAPGVIENIVGLVNGR